MMNEMNSFKIQEVNDQKRERAFMYVPRSLYAGDNAWVCPLDEDIKNIFDRRRNPLFKNGDARKWILISQSRGQIIGRIAAFYNTVKATKHKVPTGGVGFFECIDDQRAANLLFDTAKAWLMENGLEAMEGPVNFGENDRFWGLQIEGFTQPAYGMPYNKTYYQHLFEDYGFVCQYEQISRILDISNPLPERFTRIAEWVANKPQVEIAFGSRKKPEVFARVMQEVYNDAWKQTEFFTPITDDQVHEMVKTFRHVIIDPLIPYAMINDEPAAFIVALPDLNQIFKPFNGKFPLWRKLQFLLRSRNQFQWYLKKGILDRGRVIAMGVKEKYRKYGMESAMMIPAIIKAREMGFKEMELSWVGDFNIGMNRLHEATGSMQARKHITYLYEFDQNG